MTNSSATGSDADLDRLLVAARAAGLGPVDLDDSVHDAAAAHGSDVNNGGLPEQLAYLISQYGPAAVERLLTDLA